MNIPERIAGYRTERRAVACPLPKGGERKVDVLCVADLETMVDRDRLLRDPEAPDPPYWAIVWIGARAVAGRLLGSPPPVSSVLDLGCGLGLAGVAAGIAGSPVCFADIIPEALEFARANALMNGLSDFETKVLDFTRDRLDRSFELILAADVAYRPDHYRPLADFLDAHTSAGGTILLTESLRADARAVLDMLIDRGFADTKVPVWVEEEGRLERTWVHELQRRGRPAGNAPPH
ncbi:MAG: methyltransferase domain-containing protein [Deltaproteobacteria bacterium]|nr:MAG: methyltransferase domain-containing protein [Deltaproteobacteria bacterium]